MGLKSKLETLGWFLYRPNLYHQLIYLFYQHIFPHAKDDTRNDATEWCKKKCLSSTDAIKQLTGQNNVPQLKEVFPSFFDHANKMVKDLPVKMGGEADLELLYYLAEYAKVKTVVETGVAYGWSSAILLLSLQNREGGLLYSTDMPYAKMNNEDFVGCVVPDELRQKWRLYKLPDRQALPKIERKINSFDLCHYDSDKSYRGRMWAYNWLWLRLRRGGLFISDDVNDNVAFKDFTERINQSPVIVYYKPEEKYVGILIKASEK